MSAALKGLASKAKGLASKTKDTASKGMEAAKKGVDSAKKGVESAKKSMGDMQKNMGDSMSGLSDAMSGLSSGTSGANGTPGTPNLGSAVNVINNIAQSVKGIDLSGLLESREYFALSYKFKKEIKAVFKRVKEKTCGVMNTPEFHKAIQESMVSSILSHMNSNAHFLIKEEKKTESNNSLALTKVVEKEMSFYYQMYAILFLILLDIDTPETHLFIINQFYTLLYEIDMDNAREETKEEIKDEERLKIFRRKEWLDTFIQKVIVANDVFIHTLLNSNLFLENMGKNSEFLRNIIEKTNENGFGNEFTDQMMKFATTSNENKRLFQLFVDKLVSLSTTEGIDITDFKEDDMSDDNYESRGGAPHPPKPHVPKPHSTPHPTAAHPTTSTNNTNSSNKTPTTDASHKSNTSDSKHTEKSKEGAKEGAKEGENKEGAKEGAKEGVKEGEPIAIPGNVDINAQPKKGEPEKGNQPIQLPPLPSLGDIKIKLPESSSYFSLSRIRREIRDTLRKIREKICDFMSQKEFKKFLQDSIYNDIEKNIVIHSNFFTLLDESNQNDIVIHNSFFYQLYAILFNLLLKYNNYDVYNYVTEHCVDIVRHLKENVDKSDLNISRKDKKLLLEQKKWVDVFTEKVITPSELFMNELLKKEQVCSVIFHQTSFLNYSITGTFLPNLVFYWTSAHYSSQHDRIEDEHEINEDAEAIKEEGIEDSLEKRKLELIEKENKEKLRIKRVKFQRFVRNLKKNADSITITTGGEAPEDAKPDVKPDVKPDAKPDAKPDVKSDAKPDVKPDAKSDAKPDVKPDAKPDVKPDAKPDAKSDVKPDAKPDAKSDAKIPPTNEISKADTLKLINSIKIPKFEKTEFTSSEVGVFNPSKGCPDAIIELLGITSQDNNPVIKRIMKRAIQESKVGAQYQKFLLDHLNSLGLKNIEDLYEETKAKTFTNIYQETENFKQNRLNPDSEENQDSFIHSMSQKGNKKNLIGYILKIPDNKGYEILIECILTNEKLKNNQLFLFRKLFEKLNIEEMKSFLLNQRIDLNCSSINKMIQKKEKMKGGNNYTKEEAYKILGLDTNASNEDVKKSYKKLVLKYHPDKCKLEKEVCDKNIREINGAKDQIENNNFKSDDFTKENKSKQSNETPSIPKQSTPEQPVPEQSISTPTPTPTPELKENDSEQSIPTPELKVNTQEQKDKIANDAQMNKQLLNSGLNVVSQMAESKKKKLVHADNPCSPEMTEIFQKGVNSANGGPPIDATILKKMITFSITPKNIESIFEKEVLMKSSITSAEMKNTIKRFMVLLLKPNQSIPPSINNDVNIQKKIILLNKIFAKLPNFDSREIILSVFENLSLHPVSTPNGSLFVNLMNHFYKEYENTVKIKNKLNEIIIDIINDNREVDQQKIQVLKSLCDINSPINYQTSNTNTPTLNKSSMPRQGMPMPGQGMPMPGQGMPMSGPGMPMPRQGMPMPGQGMPMPGQGMPMQGQIKSPMNQTMRAYGGKKKNKTYRKRFKGKRL